MIFQPVYGLRGFGGGLTRGVVMFVFWFAVSFVATKLVHQVVEFGFSSGVALP